MKSTDSKTRLAKMYAMGDLPSHLRQDNSDLDMLTQIAQDMRDDLPSVLQLDLAAVGGQWKNCRFVFFESTIRALLIGAYGCGANRVRGVTGPFPVRDGDAVATNLPATIFGVPVCVAGASNEPGAPLSQRQIEKLGNAIRETVCTLLGGWGIGVEDVGMDIKLSLAAEDADADED